MLSPFTSLSPFGHPRFAAGGGGTPAWYDAVDPGSTDTGDPFSGYARRQPVTAGQSGHCTAIRFWCEYANSADSIKGALYDSSRNLLSSGLLSSHTATSGSWVEMPITSVAVTSGAVYGVTFILSNGGFMPGKYLSGQPSGSSFIDFAVSYASFPQDPFASGGDVTWNYAQGMYIEP